MKIKTQRLFLLIFITLFKLNAFGDENSIRHCHYSAREILKPSDRIDNITRLALEKIKISASAEAGGYVLGHEHLINGSYSQNIQVISGTLVTLSNINSHIETQKNGEIVLTVDADTSVELESLKQRVNSIQENAALRKILDQKNQQYLAALKNREYGKVYTI